MMARKKSGCGYWILGTILVILGLVLTYSLIGGLSSLFSMFRLKGEPAVVNMGGYPVALIVNFALFEILFMLLQPDGILSEKVEGDARRNRIIRRVGVSACTVLSVVVVLITSNWYTAWTKDGIQDYKVFKTESFTWEEATEGRIFYMNGLGYEVKSPKGHTYSLFSGVSGFNDQFEVDFNNQYNYAVFINEQLKNANVNVQLKFDDARKLKEAYADYYPTTWQYVKLLLPGESTPTEPESSKESST